MMTINISMPGKMYVDAKKFMGAGQFGSVSELVRDALRRLLYPKLTENGFTREFEEEVLRREKQSMENDIVWSGAESDLVKYAKGAKKPELYSGSKKTIGGEARIEGRSEYTGRAV